MTEASEIDLVVTEAEAAAWLDRYKQAWTSRSVDLLLPLFTRDVDYRERRFGRPLKYYDSLADYWRARVGDAQRDVSFDYQIWAVKNDECYYGFQARFLWLPINGIMELDGVCRVRFVRASDGGVICSKFEEWLDHRES